MRCLRVQLVLFDAFGDLFAVYLNVLWRFNAYTHLVTVDRRDDDADVVTDVDCFVLAA